MEDMAGDTRVVNYGMHHGTARCRGRSLQKMSRRRKTAILTSAVLILRITHEEVSCNLELDGVEILDSLFRDTGNKNGDEEMSGCEKCSFRARYDKNPRSILGRIWKWHIGWCPGWKSYVKSLPDEKRKEVTEQYR
jgi:hypothetical protein